MSNRQVLAIVAAIVIGALILSDKPQAQVAYGSTYLVSAYGTGTGGGGSYIINTATGIVTWCSEGQGGEKCRRMGQAFSN